MRWIVLLMLAGCGEGTGDGPTVPAPGTAPLCAPPEVQPCPEGTTYETRTDGDVVDEGCYDARRAGPVFVRRMGDAPWYYVEGTRTTHCWPDGPVAMVRECDDASCGASTSICYGTDREPADCAQVNAELSAAWQ